MRRLLLLVVLTAGCVSEAPQPLARLGGPEASEPVASIGMSIPLQAATKTLLGQALLPNNKFTATLSSGINPGVSIGIIPSTTRAAVCLNTATPSSNTCQLYDLSNTTILNGQGGINFGLSGITKASIDGTGKFVIGAAGTGMASSIRGTATLDFASAAAAACSAVLTITVTGATTTAEVALLIPNAANTTGSIFTAWVSAADTVSVKHCCMTGTCDPASASFAARVFNP